MNTLLLFFAFPVAIVILSIALQKILKCPILVAGTFFAILLIVTFAAFDSSFLIYVIIYTIISYITALLAKIINDLVVKKNECKNGIDNITLQSINNSCNSSNNTNYKNIINNSYYRKR